MQSIRNSKIIFCFSSDNIIYTLQTKREEWIILRVVVFRLYVSSRSKIGFIHFLYLNFHVLYITFTYISHFYLLKTVMYEEGLSFPIKYDHSNFECYLHLFHFYSIFQSVHKVRVRDPT